jgi:hypothetical protein
MTAHESAADPSAKLQELDDDIDDARDRLAEEHGGGERRFIDDGALDEDQPVDNTIVPPG